MPLVRLVHKGVRFPTPTRLEKIKGIIKEIVAGALTCPDSGGELVPKEVEVEVKVSELGDSLHERYAVMFYIDANDFPSRKENLQSRSNAIAVKISTIPEFHGMSGFVWVRLFPAAFTDFAQTAQYAKLLEQFEQRRTKNRKIKRKDNTSLRAGSPMYFYCVGCGAEMTVPENYTARASSHCDACGELKKLGLLK